MGRGHVGWVRPELIPEKGQDMEAWRWGEREQETEAALGMGGGIFMWLPQGGGTQSEM